MPDSLGAVGHGATTTYGALAAAIGLTDDGPRQVGGAMRCHVPVSPLPRSVTHNSVEGAGYRGGG
ncbi:MAG: MGMT family protein [Pseudonocardiaceae bacterium]